MLVPDWLAGVYRQDLPKLNGKLKLMPLPAWEPGGRRVGVRGATGLTLSTSASDSDAAWAAAKHLYFSSDLAEAQFAKNHIISPVRSLWDEAYYHQPDPFFSGQASGSLYIKYAPELPYISSHPLRVYSENQIAQALETLHA